MADRLEKALKRVQQAARAPQQQHELGHTWMSFAATAKTGEQGQVELHELGAWAFDEACALLADDLRFEYMDEKAREAAVQTFAATAGVNRSESHVASFITEHEHETLHLTWSFTVEHLVLDRRREMFGAMFIPAAEVELPSWVFGDPPQLDSVIAVECVGTGGQQMMGRAKESAEHALRLLRAGLREHLSITDDQLRFRLGVHYWFTVEGQRRPGWQRRPGEPITFGPLNDELIDLATSPAIATLPEHGANDVECRANRALAWWERSFFATEPIVKIVFLFAALETILGDQDGGLKAENVAMRRAALSETLGLGFSLPGRAVVLYEHVRSKAVHGEEPYTVLSDQAMAFEWDVRKAISEYLRYARQEHLAQRKQVRASLEAKRGEIEAFLDTF